MASNPFRFFWDSPIRVKLIIAFSIVVLMMLVMTAINYTIFQTEEATRQSLLDAQNEASLAREISIEFQQTRSVVANASFTFMTEGAESAAEIYSSSQGHTQNMLNLIDSIEQGLEPLAANGEGTKAEEFEALNGLRQTTIEYDETLSTILDIVVTRGSNDTGLAGEVMDPLVEINKVVDAESTILWVERYTRSVMQDAVLEIPLAFTNLQREIEDSDLPDAEKDRLKDLLGTSRSAFVVLVQHDLGMLEQTTKMYEAEQSLTDQLRAFIDYEEGEQAEALERLENVQSLRQTYIPILVLVTLLVSIAFAFEISRRITNPIEYLAQTAGRIAEGNYKLRVAQTTGDEVGKLGDAFNKMVEAIGQREAELVQQTKDLRIATAKAKEAARVRREFLANVSHELRTPLNAIIGFSDGLLLGMYGELNEKQTHKTERLRENGLRLLALVNDILDLTRIEVRRVELNPAPFSPAALVERMQQQMTSLAEDKGLAFSTVVEPAVPDTLIGDEQRIEQIVVNLLSNAFKFTEEGSVSLLIKSDPDQHTWELVVQDTGIGIPPHAKDIIFEEFRQLDGSSTRAYKGTGLGLAITRNLVRLMEGHIDVQSEQGQGSTFVVTLPLKTEEDKADLITDTLSNINTLGADS